jgi:hypothetical protein
MQFARTVMGGVLLLVSSSLLAAVPGFVERTAEVSGVRLCSY